MQGICSACTIYADNIMCMDICGSTLSVGQETGRTKGNAITKIIAGLNVMKFIAVIIRAVKFSLV